MDSSYCKLSLGQLRTELRRRGAKVSGRKKELIERLQAYERNQNFNPHEDLLPEFTMTLPKTTAYRDLNSDIKMAPINTEKANEFLSEYGCGFDSKVVDLYNEKYIMYLRLFPSEFEDFIKAECRAEMRKSVKYVVDISVTRSGYVNEAQCECGAGDGPYGHCKHIRTVLYACCKFVRNGDFKAETTCTEKLQSFHKAKKHTGSPLKARDLNLESADICDLKNFDPRPVKFRKMDSYPDHFYNTCMNFPGISKTPIFQTFPPANARAAANDHAYLSQSHEDKFLNACLINKINEKERSEIEMLTRGQGRNERWFEERGKRIQSSNFHRICCATDRTNHTKLAETLVSGQTTKQSEATRHGLKYEKEAIHHYEEKCGVKVEPCGIFVSKTLPFLGASPDGVVDDTLLLEVKCPFTAKNKPVTPLTVPYVKEVNGQLTLSSKHQYFYQIQGQLFCANRQFCDLIIYTLADAAILRVERDNEFITTMIEKLEKFYADYFRAALLKKLFFKEL